MATREPAPPTLSVPEPVPDPPPPGGSKWSRERAKAFLASCATRAVMVERDEDDKRIESETGQPAYQYVGWNGWSYLVPKGQVVEVPEPIALILDEMRRPLRTAQAQEARVFFTDIGRGLGVDLNKT